MATTETKNKMVETDEQRPERLEAGAEAGPGAVMDNSNQTGSAVDTAKEKEMNNTAGAFSSEEGSLVAEEKPQEEEKKAEPPVDPEKTRSKAATALIMAALMVWALRGRIVASLKGLI